MRLFTKWLCFCLFNKVFYVNGKTPDAGSVNTVINTINKDGLMRLLAQRDMAMMMMTIKDFFVMLS